MNKISRSKVMEVRPTPGCVTPEMAAARKAAKALLPPAMKHAEIMDDLRAELIACQQLRSMEKFKRTLREAQRMIYGNETR